MLQFFKYKIYLKRYDKLFDLLCIKVNTGQRINELENGPSSNRLKKQFFDSNRGGFGVLRNLV